MRLCFGMEAERPWLAEAAVRCGATVCLDILRFVKLINTIKIMFKDDVIQAITDADRIIEAKLQGFRSDARLEDMKRSWRELIHNCDTRLRTNQVREYHPDHITSGGRSLERSSNVDDFLRKYRMLEDIIKQLY